MNIITKSQLKANPENHNIYIPLLQQYGLDYDTACIVMSYATEQLTTEQHYWRLRFCISTIRDNNYITVGWYWGYDMSWWEEDSKHGDSTLRCIGQENWEREIHPKILIYNWLLLSAARRGSVYQVHYTQVAKHIICNSRNARNFWIHDRYLQVDDVVYKIEHNNTLDDRDAIKYAPAFAVDYMDLFVRNVNMDVDW